MGLKSPLNEPLKALIHELFCGARTIFLIALNVILDVDEAMTAITYPANNF